MQELKTISCDATDGVFPHFGNTVRSFVPVEFPSWFSLFLASSENPPDLPVSGTGEDARGVGDALLRGTGELQRQCHAASRRHISGLHGEIRTACRSKRARRSRLSEQSGVAAQPVQSNGDWPGYRASVVGQRHRLDEAPRRPIEPEAAPRHAHLSAHIPHGIRTAAYNRRGILQNMGVLQIVRVVSRLADKGIGMVRKLSPL